MAYNLNLPTDRNAGIFRLKGLFERVGCVLFYVQSDLEGEES